MLAGVLESLLPSGHETDFSQRLEVLQHENGQAVGHRRPAACLGAGAAPRLERVPVRCRLQPVLTR